MKSSIVTVFFIAILLFISFHFLLILKPFSTPILFAAVLAFAFYPLRNRLAVRIQNDTAAALITVLLVLAATVPLLVWILGKVNAEGARGLEWLTGWIRNKEYIGFIDWLSNLPVVNRARATGLFEKLKTGVGVWASESLSMWGTTAAAQAAQLTKNLLLLALHVMFTILFFFLFLKDGERIVEFFYRILPLEEEHKKEVLTQTRETFAAVIHGQMLASGVKAVFIGLTFWLMGLPLPAFFAAMTFFASMLPIVGASVVWLPFVAFLASQQDFTRAGILFFIGLVPVGLADNVIQPLVIGRRSGLPYSLLLIGVIGGISQYGVFGIFIGPLVMSLFFVFINIYRRQFTDRGVHG